MDPERNLQTSPFGGKVLARRSSLDRQARLSCPFRAGPPSRSQLRKPGVFQAQWCSESTAARLPAAWRLSTARTLNRASLLAEPTFPRQLAHRGRPTIARGTAMQRKGLRRPIIQRATSWNVQVPTVLAQTPRSRTPSYRQKRREKLTPDNRLQTTSRGGRQLVCRISNPKEYLGKSGRPDLVL